MKALTRLGIVASVLVSASAQAQVTWKPIPPTDPAANLLTLIKADQPTYSSLPDGATYNYLWAENMLAWMVAERSGLMSASECSARLSGLLKKVGGWRTYHGFYYDSYDSVTGIPTSDNIYFQGWWLWALVIAKSGYPQVAPIADMILSRYDYVAAGMVSPDKHALVADRNTATGKISYYIQATADIFGELRTSVIAYTWLTGDVTPWQVDAEPNFISVGGQQTLSVWHHFAFDPFYVHSCYPELGYFQKSWDNLLVGANQYRTENGMSFYATRMEPLEAWNESPGTWPNTEHRVSKPWTAWLADASAPVMEKAWIPGHGLTQYFDNWNFYWGYGSTGSAHAHVVGTSGSASHGAFQAAFNLETMSISNNPARLTKLELRVIPDRAHPPTGPLVIKVNGSVVGQVNPTSSLSFGTPIVIVPKSLVVLSRANMVRLETSGTGAWLVAQPEHTFRTVQWLDDSHAAADTTAIALTVFVDGQRADRENAYAFLCRASGVFGNYPYRILLEHQPENFGKNLVAWVGSYSSDVQYAHVIYNVSSSSESVSYHLSPWESGKSWIVVDYADPTQTIPSQQSGTTMHWQQSERQTVLLKQK